MNNLGQLYTIEGIAAAILMVITAYLAVSTTTVLTPQDVHIVDMQLQQLGNDALAAMDTPDSFGAEDDRTESNLTQYISDIGSNGPENFRDEFLYLLNSPNDSRINSIEFNATIYYRDPNSFQISNIPFSNSSTHYHENAVKVSRWVYLPNGVNHPSPIPALEDDPHSVLLEVLLWRK